MIRIYGMSVKKFLMATGDLSSTQDLEIDYKDCDLVNGTNICYLNTTRKSINKIVNEKLKPANAVYLECSSDDGYEQNAYIYEGLKVILSKTIKEKEDKIFSKNETSTITKMENGKITIGDKYTFDLKDFHKVCLLGYATTIHKSQGDTCNGVINIFNWKHSLMNGNLRYTVITRATGLRSVKIVNAFNETYQEPEGVIYKGVCSETGKKYIGSTRDYEKRVKAHQSPDNDCSSKQLINPTFHILAKYPSISKKQLLRMEQKYMNSVECINQQKATRE
jgi:predicted GIY-YIG superfamily endonuclease